MPVIAVYVCPHTVMSSLSTALDCFALANRFAGKALFRLKKISADGQPVTTGFGELAVEGGLELAADADHGGRLTFTSELVRIIDHLLTTGAPYGTYNATNDGLSASWADITREIFANAGYDTLSVTDTTTSEYYADKVGIAPRPLKSEMDLAKLHATGFVSRAWLN